MAASASPLGKAGAGSDSKGGEREVQQKRTKEIDGKLSNNGLECDDNGTKEEENIMEDKVFEDSTMKLYVRTIATAEKLSKMLDVRLNTFLSKNRWLLIITEQRRIE